MTREARSPAGRRETTAPVAPEHVDWRYQYVVSTESLPLPEGFTTRRVGALVVGLGPGLPWREIRDTTGASLGAALGWPIDTDAARFCDDPVVVSTPRGDAEGALEALGGSWLAVLAPRPGVHGGRVYLDADATLPLVYRRDRPVAASSTGLLLDAHAYVEDFDAELFERLCVIRDGWFPAGLTAHHTVGRVLCNHYLDLEAWEPRRHWPREAPPVASDPDEAVEDLARTTARATQAIVEQHRPVVSLTAGNETRFLLAACRDLVPELTFFTLGTDRRRSVDVEIACRLAERFGLRHSLVPHRLASPEEEAEWLYLGGHCVGGPNVAAHPGLRALRPHDVLVNGLGGEVGRGFFWRPSDGPDTAIDAEAICTRFGMARHDRVVASVEDWLTSLPSGDALFVLDLAYLELRMAAWAYANPFGSSKEILHLAPMISRRGYDRLLGLPPDWKRTSRFVDAAIRASWPELGEIPINRSGPLRDLWRTARGALRHPHLVAKRLRKRLG